MIWAQTAWITVGLVKAERILAYEIPDDAAETILGG